MFREMRRKNQQLSLAECEEILRAGTSGVLAVTGDDNYPYAVPLSYVYHDSKIYFHCAVKGHKLDAIASNEKVSFCVTGQDQVVPEEYTTYYRSVIIFGKARVISDDTEKQKAIEMLSDRYAPDQKERSRTEINRAFKMLHMVEVTIDHMTGKKARELMNKGSQ